MIVRPLCLSLLLVGCADTLVPLDNDVPDAPIQPRDPDADPTVDAEVPTGGPFSTVGRGDGSYTTVVDATSTTAWIHGDFETRIAIDATGPWDLRFQRFHLSTNGGISGAAGVEVAALEGTTFAAVTTAPAAGWTTDQADGDDANVDPDYAFEQGDGWYDYDPSTHVLTPKPLVYVVRTASNASMIKLEIEKYYDTAGTSGVLTLHWAPL